MASIVSGIALAVWRIVLLVRYYDPYNGGFAKAAEVQMRALGYVTLAVIILMAASYFFIRKTAFEPFSASSNQVSVFSSSLCGFVFLAVCILLLIYYTPAIFKANGSPFYKILQILSLIFLPFSAVYFIFSASVNRSESKVKKAFSFFPAIWALCYMAASYMNPAYQYTDPNRILCNISLAALLLFFLYETRNTVSKPQNPVRFAVSLVAMVCVLVYMLPLFTLTAFWEIPMTAETLFEAVECGVVFYIFSVLYTMVLSVKKEPAVADESAE